MKRVLVYIIMLLYVNSYMFFPVVDDIDAYDECGLVVDEVNSIVEYVDEVVLDHDDCTPDHNEAQHSHVIKCHPIVINQFAIVEVGRPIIKYEAPRQYAVMNDQKATHRAYDIVAPPPDASSISCLPS